MDMKFWFWNWLDVPFHKQDIIPLVTVSCAYGIYDIEYQIPAKNCRVQNMSANNAFFHLSTAISVSIMKAKTKTVERIRFSWNILFSCFHGPIKNIVL